MKIKTLIIGELSTNCYLVWDEKTGEGIVIDPADEANFITEEILALKIKPVKIVATHGHFDHLLASWELTMAFNIPLLIHERDLPIVTYMNESASWWLKRRIVEKTPEKLSFIKENDKINFGQEKLLVIETPGHSPGGICFYSDKEKVLFSGDTLFAQGAVGRTDLPYSSPKDLQKSLKKLSKLPPETKIYPGHGEDSVLGETLKDIDKLPEFL